MPSVEQFIPAIDTLEEISSALGTFRARLRVARVDERVPMVIVENY